MHTRSEAFFTAGEITSISQRRHRQEQISGMMFVRNDTTTTTTCSDLTGVVAILSCSLTREVNQSISQSVPFPSFPFFSLLFPPLPSFPSLPFPPSPARCIKSKPGTRDSLLSSGTSNVYPAKYTPTHIRGEARRGDANLCAPSREPSRCTAASALCR